MVGACAHIVRVLRALWALSGLARTAGVRFEEIGRRVAVSYSLVRSPARLPLGLALVRGGSGLSLWFEIRVSVLSSLCLPLRNGSSARRGLARDAAPSFRETDLSSESPLNIRAGPHPGRTGTRLSGRVRETGRGGLVELASDQTSSSTGAYAMLPPGPMGPAQVKSCERYRCDRQGSILPIPMHGRPNPEGQAFPLRFRTREGGRGLTVEREKRKEERGKRVRERVLGNRVYGCARWIQPSAGLPVQGRGLQRGAPRHEGLRGWSSG